jgi:predicted DCC family thiol-disulfide oxidoreductase YuxK
MSQRGSVSKRVAEAAPYSYRSDPDVPSFPDDRPLLVFDGVCVLCCWTAKFVIERDRNRRFRFATAQSPLGQALFRHYGLDTQNFETNLVIADGRAHSKLDSVIVSGRLIGGFWRVLGLLRLIPRALGDWIYDTITRHRYRLFGRTEHCMMPPPECRDRFIGL